MVFKVGDLVWAKMKGFPPWPGVVADPPETVNVSKSKKGGACVFFFGTKNYSWVEYFNMHDYVEFEETMSKMGKGPMFTKALQAIKDYRINGGTIGGDTDVSQSEEAFDKLFNSTPKPKPQSSEAVKANDSTATLETLETENGENTQNEESNNELLSPTEEPKSAKRVRKATTKVMENAEYDNTPKKFKPSPPRKDFSPISGFRNKRYQERPVVMESKDSLKNAGTNAKAPNIKIGFLGLGTVGLPLAKSLVNSGLKITVWNRTLEKCEIFEDGSTSMAYTPGEVVNACDIIFSCMKDSEVVRHVLHGNGGVLSRINSKKSYVEMTAIDIQASSEIQDAIKSRGGKYLDAMLLGTRSDAENGRMVFLTSGDRSVYEQCLPYFDAMGRKTLYFGDGGNAVKMASVVNVISGAMTGSFAEALALADRAGVSVPDTMEIIQASSLSCEYLKNRIGAVFQSSTENNIFPLQHLQNNVKGVVTLSDTLEEPVPLSATVNEMLKTAKKFGYATSDAAMVYIRSKF